MTAFKSWEDLVNRYGEIFKLLGLNLLESKIFAFLYFVEPLATQAEISEKLNVARSATSMALKVLEKMDFVKKIKKEGKNYYYVQITPFELFRVILEKYRKFMEPKVREFVEKRIRNLRGLAKELLETRLRQHIVLFGWIQELEDRIEAFESE